MFTKSLRITGISLALVFVGVGVTLTPDLAWCSEPASKPRPAGGLMMKLKYSFGHKRWWGKAYRSWKEKKYQRAKEENPGECDKTGPIGGVEGFRTFEDYANHVAWKRDQERQRSLGIKEAGGATVDNQAAELELMRKQFNADDAHTRAVGDNLLKHDDKSRQVLGKDGVYINLAGEPTLTSGSRRRLAAFSALKGTVLGGVTAGGLGLGMLGMGASPAVVAPAAVSLSAMLSGMSVATAPHMVVTIASMAFTALPLVGWMAAGVVGLVAAKWFFKTGTVTMATKHAEAAAKKTENAKPLMEAASRRAESRDPVAKAAGFVPEQKEPNAKHTDEVRPVKEPQQQLNATSTGGELDDVHKRLDALTEDQAGMEERFLKRMEAVLKNRAETVKTELKRAVEKLLREGGDPALAPDGT